MRFPDKATLNRLLSHSSRHVRNTYIEYYKSHNHTYFPSSSLIPRDDDGTYFVNSGMNQFKPIFSGTVSPQSPMSALSRAVNSQRCGRVGGKHNDLDVVGTDLYHHTFFEMLGSWSFGDYFKEKACRMAWELLTGDKFYGLEKDRLYVTYFGGDSNMGLSADLETRDIWRALGVPEGRILPGGSSDNFWDAGFTGPCGPCTEIHYDHLGGRFVPSLVNSGSWELVEIGNWVFIEYDRMGDGSVVPLPCPGVDNGIGLERIVAVLNGTCSNYETDLFRPIIDQIHHVSGGEPYRGRVGLVDDPQQIDTAYRVVADHTRMITYSIADGLMPGNRGNEMKLRTILNRCFRHGHSTLNVPRGFIANLTGTVIDILGDTFPVEKHVQNKIMEVINHEEKRYLSTKFKSQSPRLHVMGSKETNQAEVNTWGSVTDLQEMKVPATVYEPYLYSRDPEGVYKFEDMVGDIVGLRKAGDLTESIKTGDEGLLFLNRTPFYSCSGGQEADKGYIRAQSGVAEVLDVRTCGEYIGHLVRMGEGELRVGQSVGLEVDKERRLGCMRSHSGAHIVSYVLGKFVRMLEQRGSSVSPDQFTFDFSGFMTSMTVERGNCMVYVPDEALRAVDCILDCCGEDNGQSVTLCRDYMLKSCSRDNCSYVHVDGPLKAAIKSFYADSSDLKLSASLRFSRSLEMVETISNQIIRSNLGISSYQIPLEDALILPHLKKGLEDSSYPSTVRVVEVDAVAAGGGSFGSLKHFSTHTAELCCGTHVLNSRDIKAVTLVGFSGVSQGKKRVTVLCGDEAVEALKTGERLREECLRMSRLVRTAHASKDWHGLLKSNNKATTVNVIPRSYRDRLLSDSANLRYYMNNKLDEIRLNHVLNKYCEVIDGMSCTPEPPVVLQVEFSDFKNITTAFKRTELLTSTLFVPPSVDSVDQSLVVFGTPLGYDKVVEGVTKGLFSGLDVQIHRGELNLFVSAVIPRISFDQLGDRCRETLVDQQ